MKKDCAGWVYGLLRNDATGSTYLNSSRWSRVFKSFMVSKFFSVLKTALLVGTVRNCVKITSLTFEGIFPSAVLVDGTFTQDAVDAPSVKLSTPSRINSPREDSGRWTFYRAMFIVLSWYCYCKSSVRPPVCPWHWLFDSIKLNKHNKH